MKGVALKGLNPFAGCNSRGQSRGAKPSVLHWDMVIVHELIWPALWERVPGSSMVL